MAAIIIKKLRRNEKIRAALAETNYIVCKKFGSSKWEVTLSKGKIAEINIEESLKDDTGWKQLIIFNFTPLRKTVDEKLNSL